MRFCKFMIFITISFLLVSCQQELDLEQDDNCIQFAPAACAMVEIGSRSPENTLTRSFGVLGYCLPYVINSTTVFDNNSGTAPWIEKYQRTAPKIFYNKEIAANGVYSNAPKWMNSRYKYSYFAYYPYDANNNDGKLFDLATGDNTLGAPAFIYTMPVLDNPVNPADIPDAMIASAIDVTEMDGNVSLVFNHILSGIRLRIRNYDSPSLTITSASIVGAFFQKAGITFDTTGKAIVAVDSETKNITYSLIDGDTDVSTTNGEATVKYLGESIMLFVGTIDGKNTFGSGIKLQVSYKHKGKAGVEIEGENEFLFKFPDNFNPLPGNIYTYELQFLNNSLMLSMVVQNEEPWEEDAGDKDVTFE